MLHVLLLRPILSTYMDARDPSVSKIVTQHRRPPGQSFPNQLHGKTLFAGTLDGPGKMSTR